MNQQESELPTVEQRCSWPCREPSLGKSTFGGFYFHYTGLPIISGVYSLDLQQSRSSIWKPEKGAQLPHILPHVGCKRTKPLSHYVPKGYGCGYQTRMPHEKMYPSVGTAGKEKGIFLPKCCCMLLSGQHFRLPLHLRENTANQYQTEWIEQKNLCYKQPRAAHFSKDSYQLGNGIDCENGFRMPGSQNCMILFRNNPKASNCVQTEQDICKDRSDQISTQTPKTYSDGHVKKVGFCNEDKSCDESSFSNKTVKYEEYFEPENLLFQVNTFEDATKWEILDRETKFESQDAESVSLCETDNSDNCHFYESVKQEPIDEFSFRFQGISKRPALKRLGKKQKTVNIKKEDKNNQLKSN